MSRHVSAQHMQFDLVNAEHKKTVSHMNKTWVATKTMHNRCDNFLAIRLHNASDVWPRRTSIVTIQHIVIAKTNVIDTVCLGQKQMWRTTVYVVKTHVNHN